MCSVEDIIARLKGKIKLEFEVERMEPLFENQFAYDEFTKRHSSHHVKTADIASHKGNCYLEWMRVQQQPRLL